MSLRSRNFKSSHCTHNYSNQNFEEGPWKSFPSKTFHMVPDTEVGLSQILIPLGYKSQFHYINISTNPSIGITLTLFKSQHRFILSEKVEYINEGRLGLLWSQTYSNLITCKFPPLHSFSHEVNALKQDSVLRKGLKGHKHATRKQTATGKWPTPKLTSSCSLCIHSIKTINFRRTVWVISLGISESTIKTYVGLEVWMWFCRKQEVKWRLYDLHIFLKGSKTFSFCEPTFTLIVIISLRDSLFSPFNFSFILKLIWSDYIYLYCHSW